MINRIKLFAPVFSLFFLFLSSVCSYADRFSQCHLAITYANGLPEVPEKSDIGTCHDYANSLSTISDSGTSDIKRHGTPFRVMEYNVENLFDAEHDSLKDDRQYLPGGNLNWTKDKYWKKVNAIARAVVLSNTDSTDTFVPPALIALCEVENDSCVHALTRRSLLCNAGYDYIITHSPDKRGIDVALLYKPVMFRPDTSYPLRVDTIPGMRKTRDILYVRGTVCSSGIQHSTLNTQHSTPNAQHSTPNAQHSTLNSQHSTSLHVFVIHTPSRLGGESKTRPYRRHVIDRLMSSLDSIRSVDREAKIVVLGDFNDYSTDMNLQCLAANGLVEVSKGACGANNPVVKGTYQYQGQWQSLDHIFVSKPLVEYFSGISVADHPDLLEPDTRNGGFKPRRFFISRRVNYNGYSDHLPLICDFFF